MDRKKQIIRTSIIGIIVNIVLVIFKASIGLITNSIAILLDAVNNLSDVLSSVITIIGTAIAGKKPDKKHPFGHGRVEYITAIFVAVIVLIAGLTSLKESAVKIFNPEETNYTVISLAIIAVAVIAKIATGIYVRSVGKKIDSGSLIASGTDALFDAVISSATLVGGIVSMLFGLNLEGYLGVVISGFILKAGIEMLLDTVSSMIGERADAALTKGVKELVCSFDGVYGAYDLILHNYGPTNIIGSVHIEVPDNTTAKELHKLTNSIAAAVYQKYNIIMTVGVYAQNSTNTELAQIRHSIQEISEENDAVIQMHGFYGDAEEKLVSFDLIVDFSADAQAVRNEICEQLSKIYPDYTFYIVLDTDFTD